MIFDNHHTKNLAPNIVVLKELKVPESNISCLLTHFPEAIVLNHDEFRETVIEVEKMGFDPLKTNFVLAVQTTDPLGKG